MVKNVLAEPATQKAVGDERAQLADLYRGKARDVLVSISDTDIAKASLQQKSISSGVLLDKSLLLDGQPTSIVGVQILLDVAGALRREERQADEEEQLGWEKAHTLTLPRVSQAEPREQPPQTASRPTLAPQPEKSQEPTLPPTVRYTPVSADPHPDHRTENPLLHGLRLPGSRE
jgi:hypothetical protein